MTIEQEAELISMLDKDFESMQNMLIDIKAKFTNDLPLSKSRKLSSLKGAIFRFWYEFNDKVDPQIIKTAVLESFELSYKEILRESRIDGIIVARHIYFYLLRNFGKLTYKEIAAKAGQDHTTAIHAINKVEDYLRFKDIEYVKAYNKVASKIASIPLIK